MFFRRWNRFTVVVSLIAAAITLPLVAVLWLAVSPPSTISLPFSSVMRHTWHSLLLGAMVIAGVLLLGVGSAWLTAFHQFPGRRVLQWALVLPLALPGYVIAYAYTDFLQFSGPVQTALRDALGLDGVAWKARGLWFPEVRSLPGAALMFSLVLYPYVYLPVRAAFASGGAQLIEAARLLGRTPWSAFREVALPMARPAMAGGAALAVMETLADFGVVAHFGIETFTSGIYKSWFGLGDLGGAARLAILLLAVTALLSWIELKSRGQARYAAKEMRKGVPLNRLSGAPAWLALLAALLPCVLGFALPLGILLHMASENDAGWFSTAFISAGVNSVIVAASAAVVATVLAFALVWCVRRAPRLDALARVATLGYAVPGAVIALGVLIPLAALDNVIAAWAQQTFGVRTGLLITGSMFALVFACVVRFLAVAYNNVEAGMARVTPAMDDAARAMGFSTLALLRRVHAPLLARSLMIAALLVFIDTLKELPATLAIRPFNFDTLATQAYNLAKDERLGEAALPCLAIVAVSLLPVLSLAWTMDAKRQEVALSNADRDAGPRRPAINALGA
jgi:iron(III) transport system permease protein